MWTKVFWLDALERAIKTVAQVAVATLLVLATAGGGLVDVDWVTLASVSGLAGLISLLTSVGSSAVANRQTASLVRGIKGDNSEYN